MKPTTKKVRLAPAYNPPTKGVLHYAPILRIFKPVWKGLSGRPRKQKTFATTNVPLEISMFLSGYVAEIMRRKTVESTLIGPTFTALNQLSDAYVLFLVRLVSVIEAELSLPLQIGCNGTRSYDSSPIRLQHSS